MIEELFIPLIKEFGFPAAIAIILLYDKIKSNGSLRKAVENNTKAINKIENFLENAN